MNVNSDYPSDALPAAQPMTFPKPRIDPCTVITTRILRLTGSIETVPGVIVKAPSRACSSSGSDSDSCSDESMSSISSMSDNIHHRAYWILPNRTIATAIYGFVKQGVILQRVIPTQTQSTLSYNWKETTDNCAIKEMSLNKIRELRRKNAEDPIKEVAALQFLFNNNNDPNKSPSKIMTEEHVLVAYDTLSDERNLYSVQPFCDGGDLFSWLEFHERFNEREARYWMRQICKGLTYLQQQGISHRDVSPENLLVHQNNCLVMDFGMCLKIPYLDEHQRQLIMPQGTCGKWQYMSPEIRSNETPFDGHAVDMWAAGVILFIMLTGFPPWEMPQMTDERFRYMTGGFLVQILTEWQVDLSSEAMNLLQDMLKLDPKDRIGLKQVLQHPWMMVEEVEVPRHPNNAPQQPYV